MSINELARRSDYWGWVPFDGFEMFLAKNDCGICLRQRAGVRYEPESLALWRRLCANADLVIDVGAHTGVYTLTAYAAGAESVLSFEPYMLNYSRLMMNLSKNGFMTNGAVFAAAGSEDALSYLTTNTTASYCTSGGTLKAADGGKKYPVSVYPIDELLEKEFWGRVAAIKIDAEQMAADVIRGAWGLIESAKPGILIECTEPGLTELMAPLGYSYYMVDESWGVYPIETLTPEYSGGKLDANRLNRFCTVRGGEWITN